MRAWNNVCPACLREDAKGTHIHSAVPYPPGNMLSDRTHSADAALVECPACGSFVVTDQDLVNLKSARVRADFDYLQLSALLRERSTYGSAKPPLPPFWLQCGMEPYGPLKFGELTPIKVHELLSHWPGTVSERLDHVLCNIARLSPTGGHDVLFGRGDPATVSTLFASSAEEAYYHVKALTDLGRLEITSNSSSGYTACVTPAGWDRFDQFTRGSSSPEHPVFVAMWYGVEHKEKDSDMTEAEMQQVYDEGIDPALRRAGYLPIKVNQKHFNDGIMDEVFGLIRAAPFLVADFTGNRNGVYLEAGFARGLGRQVIHTCHKLHIGELHFDTKHFNHISWTDTADLKEKLYHRIRGTMGLGPYVRPKPD